MTTNNIMRYFDHRHLKDGPLRDVSGEYTRFAEMINNYLPDGPEKTVALRKLLESMDSAVRSAQDLTQSRERAKELPNDPSGIEEGAEELPPHPVEKQSGRKKVTDQSRRYRGSSLISPIPVGGVVNDDHPSTGAGSIKSLRDIEIAQAMRLQARNAHGY